MTPDALTRTVQDFLSEAAGAVVLEDGAVAFDLGRAKYSISGEYNKCLLHLWSAERNTVRRVLDAEVKNGKLRLAVQRLGQSRPTKLEICRERDRRSPSARKVCRAAYEHKLRRALERHFPNLTISRLTTGVDLEKSFGPIYVRGLLRKGQSIATVATILPNCEVAILSAAEIAFRWRGLEFARTRLSAEPGSFRSIQEIVFGVGAEERVLDSRSESTFQGLLAALRDARHPYGPRQHPLWRMHPERWLESLAVGDVSVLDERLVSSRLYSQVPAFSALDRAMIDVLTTTRDGRLAVVELKADEDIHLPMQGLDYWSRVEWHHARGEFPRFGYFGGQQLSTEKPLLFLVAPALHVHPATEVLLRYISPEINWVFVGIDERWREGVRVVFRKRPEAQSRQTHPGTEGSKFRLPIAS